MVAAPVRSADNGSNVRRSFQTEVTPPAHEYFAGRSSPTVFTISLLMIGGIGLVDFVTGYQISLGLFYLIPVYVLTRYGPGGAGMLASGLSAIVWLFVNGTTAPADVGLSILVWNTAVRFGFFASFAVLLRSLLASNAREAELARRLRDL